MNDYTSERLTYGEATLHLEDIHPVRVKVFMISVMTMVLRNELESTRYFLLCLDYFSMRTGRFLAHGLRLGVVVFRGRLRTRTLGVGSRLRFHVKLVYHSLHPSAHYL